MYATGVVCINSADYQVDTKIFIYYILSHTVYPSVISEIPELGDSMFIPEKHNSCELTQRD